MIGASVTHYDVIWAQDQLRKSLALAGTRVLDVELAVSKAPERFDRHGVLVDLGLRSRLAEIVSRLGDDNLELPLSARGTSP